MAANPIAYPDEATLARGRAFLNLPAKTNQKMDSLWLEVKTGGSSNKTLIYGLIIAAVIVILLVVLMVTRKNKLKKRRSMYQK